MWETLENLTNVKQVNIDKNERLLSVGAGTILLLYAAVRIPLTAVLAFLAAVYLFFRGIRGFCYFYHQLGLNTAVPLPEGAPDHNRETAVFAPPR